MEDFIRDYVRQGQAEGWSKHTVAGYRQCLRALFAFLRMRGRTRAADVLPEDLDAYFAHLTQRGIRKSSRIHWARVLYTYFRWLSENGKILSNPARNLALPDDGE